MVEEDGWMMMTCLFLCCLYLLRNFFLLKCNNRVRTDSFLVCSQQLLVLHGDVVDPIKRDLQREIWRCGCVFINFCFLPLGTCYFDWYNEHLSFVSFKLHLVEKCQQQIQILIESTCTHARSGFCRGKQEIDIYFSGRLFQCRLYLY